MAPVNSGDKRHTPANSTGSGDERQTPATNDEQESARNGRELRVGRMGESSAVPFIERGREEEESAREIMGRRRPSLAINGIAVSSQHQWGEEWGRRNGSSDFH